MKLPWGLGHKDFKTVVSDIEGHQLLEVINSHKQNEIIEVLMEQELEVRQLVQEVSIDMQGYFILKMRLSVSSPNWQYRCA